MKTLALVFAVCLHTVSSLECGGKVDIVIAVPGSNESVPEADFQHIEGFLTRLVSYYSVSSLDARVSLVLYGREPVVISDLGDAPTTQALNARITILSQRLLVRHQLSGGQNVPKAINKVREIMSDARDDVPKIGVIMTYGRDDLTSPDENVVSVEVHNSAKAARDEGIDLFAVSSSGTVPGFQNITQNNCRLFSLGDYSGLMTLLPYLASATCYVLDPEVTPPADRHSCFPELEQPPTQPGFQCKPFEHIAADPNNCAYFYLCPLNVRSVCAPGSLFDPSVRRCNHKEFVTCYSGLTCPSRYGLYPHPSVCSKFLSCSQNIPSVLECPAGLVFNPVEKYCDHNTTGCEDKDD